MDGELVRCLIARENDMTVVAEVRTVDTMPADVDRWQAQVIVAGILGGDLPSPCRQALWRNPGLALVALDRRHELTVYETRLHARPVGEAWPDRLIATVRSAAAE